jgi:tetratricopeptide (TPR) repeat protein
MPAANRIKVLSEEIRYFIFELHQKLSANARSEKRSAIHELDIEVKALSISAADDKRSSYLRSRLQETPYWLHGHEMLGETALRLDDVATAYACGQASNLLHAKDESAEGDLLIARCLLKRGAFSEALPLFEKNLPRDSRNWSLKEDYAACLIAVEEFKKAEEILKSIPDEQSTAPGKAALLFAQRKNRPEE